MKLDLSNKNFQRIETIYFQNLLANEHIDEQQIEIILLDNNSLSKLENLEKFSQLKHLSLTNNRLVEIKLISKLSHLQFVNLVNNSLTNLNAFKDLKYLTWLNVSGNQIKTLDPLKSNTNLEYLDASDNSISALSDLSSLTHLETLNLNGNEITSLEVLQHYACNLKSLYLSFNAIEDLNEVSNLVHFEKLESLSISNNPCVAYSSGTNYIENMFNYRPFVINWCLSLHSLDGSEITQKEYLKAEWLYSQGKGRHFRPGQQSQLIEYLIKICPYSANESIEEEVRLSKILEKKETYESEIHRKEEPLTSHQLPNYQPSHLIARTFSSKLQHNLSEAALSSNPQSYFSASENNLIDDINLSSSGSIFDGDLDDHIDFETNLKVFKLYGEKQAKSNKIDSEMSDDLDHANKTRYDEYDSRPIKPLDKNLFDKQLSEYTEISNEELEELKHRTIQHIRSKTTETGIKLPQQKNFSRTPPTRKLAFNNTNQSNNLASKQPNTKMRRRTVDVEIKANKVSTPSNQTRTKSKLNSSSNSPKPSTSNYLSHLNHSSNSKSSTSSITKPTLTKKPLNTKTDLKKFSESEDDSTPKSSNDNLHEDTMKSNHIKKLCQLKHHELQSRMQKQRQEMLLNKQKSLNEFKLKLKQEEEARRLEAEAKLKAQKTISFEDQCATKIQSAWRGYFVRKSIKTQKPNNTKYTDIINYLDTFRKNLNDMSNEHKNLKSMHSESIEKIWKAISSFKESLQAASTNDSVSSSAESTSLDALIKSKIEPLSSNDSEIKRENRILKQKIFLLEEKCASLEDKLNLVLKQQIKEAEIPKTDLPVNKSSVSESNEPKMVSQPKIEIYPPLRVRLQKLNEKRVALKWSPNPKNALIELTGYNIYINGKLCGKMGPSDSIASINGINQEGEYKIFIRSYFANTESDDSNEVVTRVKRKQPISTKSNISTAESDENNLTNMNTNQTSNTNELNESFSKLKSDSNEQIKYKPQTNVVSSNNEVTLKSTTEEISSTVKRNPVSDRKELWQSNSANTNNLKPSFVNNNSNDTHKHLDSPRDDLDVSNSSETSTASSTSKTTTTNTVFKPIKSSVSPSSNITDVKYSTSEPNLSNSSNPSNKNRSSFVRQSISFNDEDDLDTNLVDSNSMKFDYDSKKENLNDTDESKIESSSKLITSRTSNGKIFNQVQNVKSSH